MDKNINITKEDMQRLAEFIQKKTGIYFDEQKLSRVQKKIEQLLKRYRYDSFSAFYHQIRFAKDEVLLQELINTITINETYFWREKEQFEILANEILPQLASQKKRIRILVAPTSSGEELYSIMFAILEEGNIIKKNDIELVGIDIDTAMIRKAQVGLYTKRSIEKLPQHFKEKYFKQVGSFYQLHKSFIDSARFLQANIFDSGLKKKLGGKFDIIFSRNMLIYFEHEDRIKVFNIFYDLLNKDGYLFLGHADANSIDKTQFLPIKSGSHLYKKIES